VRVQGRWGQLPLREARGQIEKMLSEREAFSTTLAWGDKIGTPQGERERLREKIPRTASGVSLRKPSEKDSGMRRLSKKVQRSLTP